MDPALRALLIRLYQSGRRNDAVVTDRARRMLNITPETGEFLRLLVVAANFRAVLELGTSNGYSTLWLADGCRRSGGRVVTLEQDPAKHALAVENLRRAGLEPWVEARRAEIGAALPGLRDFDLVFLDTERSEYVAWWPQLQQAVRRGGLLVADNATSHPTEMAPFVQAVERTPGYSSVLVPIGNGELLILRE
jgi:predicted O-methyltransferase YrrM